MLTAGTSTAAVSNSSFALALYMILKSLQFLQPSLALRMTVATNSQQNAHSTITAGTNTVMVGESSRAHVICFLLKSLQFHQSSLVPSVIRPTRIRGPSMLIADISTETVGDCLLARCSYFNTEVLLAPPSEFICPECKKVYGLLGALNKHRRDKHDDVE